MVTGVVEPPGLTTFGMYGRRVNCGFCRLDVRKVGACIDLVDDVCNDPPLMNLDFVIIIQPIAIIIRQAQCTDVALQLRLLLQECLKVLLGTRRNLQFIWKERWVFICTGIA